MFEKAIDHLYVAVIGGDTSNDGGLWRVESYWVIAERSRVFQFDLRHEDGTSTFRIEVFECSGVRWPSSFLGHDRAFDALPMSIEHKDQRDCQTVDGWAAAYAAAIASIVVGVSTGRWRR